VKSVAEARERARNAADVLAQEDVDVERKAAGGVQLGESGEERMRSRRCLILRGEERAEDVVDAEVNARRGWRGKQGDAREGRVTAARRTIAGDDALLP
jgi:hypothetical protein